MKFLDKSYKKLLFSLIIILIISCLIQTLVPFFIALSADTTTDESGSFKVATYNVQVGLGDYAINELNEINADILALQEVYEIYYQGSLVNLSHLASILSYPYFSSPVNYNQEIYGLVILSKFPIVNSSFVELQSPVETSPRGLLAVDILKQNITIKVITTHFDLPLYYSVRFDQVKTLLLQIDNNKPTIVLGDFNTPNSIFDITYWTLMTNLHDTWVTSGNAPFIGKTWPVHWSILRVDYIFVNDYCTTVKGSSQLIRNDQTSDHCGLSVKLTV